MAANSLNHQCKTANSAINIRSMRYSGVSLGDVAVFPTLASACGIFPGSGLLRAVRARLSVIG